MYDRVEARNPAYAMHIVDCDDFSPRGFTEAELVDALNSLTETRHDYDMLMETATFEEVDAYYNPGVEEVSDSFILEAIVVDKFSKTERRMAAVVRVFNRHLSGKEIQALPAVVGKPRKTGSFAYVTVQLPFSDGQVVSVIFHAPEGDKKRITPSDRIIAFRWLLNKRDITQIVAPEDGSEVSLESIAKRITQLVVKNSARFERTQKEAQAERKALDEARDAVRDAEEKQRELMGSVAQASKDGETAQAQLSSTLALLEKQKTINAELQAKLDALRKAQSVGGGNGAGSDTETGAEGQNRQRQELQNMLGGKSGLEIFKYAYESQEPNPFLLTSENSDAYVLGRWFNTNGYAIPKDIKKSRGYTWKIFASNKKDVTAILRVDGDKVSIESGNLSIGSTSSVAHTGAGATGDNGVAGISQSVIDALPVYARGDLDIPASTPDKLVLVATRPLVGTNMGMSKGMHFAEILMSDNRAAHYIEECRKLDARVHIGRPSDQDIEKIGYVSLSDEALQSLQNSSVSADKKHRFLLSSGKNALSNVAYGEYKALYAKAQAVDLASVTAVNNATGVATNGQTADPATPPFVTTLNDILSGKYDDDTDRIDSLLDEAANEAESSGRFEEFEALFNQAADHLTELLKKKQGAM